MLYSNTTEEEEEEEEVAEEEERSELTSISCGDDDKNDGFLIIRSSEGLGM